MMKRKLEMKYISPLLLLLCRNCLCPLVKDERQNKKSFVKHSHVERRPDVITKDTTDLILCQLEQQFEIYMGIH